METVTSEFTELHDILGNTIDVGDIIALAMNTGGSSTSLYQYEILHIDLPNKYKEIWVQAKFLAPKNWSDPNRIRKIRGDQFWHRAVRLKEWGDNDE